MADTHGKPESGACRKRSHVTLAEDFQGLRSDGSGHAVVAGSCISREGVKRSRLLSGLGDTEGLAALPGEILPEDIKLWDIAVQFDTELCPEELVTVLKVADALGDQGDEAWVDSLAAAATATDWSDAAATDAMLCTLLRLPEHLLHRVMSACLDPDDEFSLLNTLRAFPVPLHIAAISGALAEGALRLCYDAAHSVMPHLQWATFPAPGLQALHVYSGGFVSVPAAAGGVLARALAAHPSLTLLELNTSDAALTPQWLHSFAACLRPGALRNLADLETRVDAHPGGHVALAACLRSLTALTSLQTTFDHFEQRGAAGVPVSAYSRLAGAPVSLPHLQHLRLLEDSTVNEVAIAQQPPNCLHSFLSLLSAPELQTVHLEFGPSRASAAAVLNAVTQSRFPGLKTLHIETAVNVGEVMRMVPGGCAVQPELPPLSRLSLAGPCCASMLAVAAAVCSATAASLTSLYLDAAEPGICSFSARCGATEARQVWEAFWQQVGRCSQLAELIVHGLVGIGPAPRVRVSHVLAAALRQLPQLRSLFLGAVLAPDEYIPVGLSGSVLGSALATLTRLTALAIAERPCRIEFDEVQPLLDACTQLRSVEQLGLCFPGVTVPLLKAAVKEMPALKSVLLAEGTPAAGGMDHGLDALQVQFPGVTFRRRVGNGL